MSRTILAHRPPQIRLGFQPRHPIAIAPPYLGGIRHGRWPLLSEHGRWTIMVPSREDFQSRSLAWGIRLNSFRLIAARHC